MSGKTKKLMNQDSREDYGDEAAKGATAIFQGNNEFDRADDEFDRACAEENAFNAARVEESASRARSRRAGNLARYAAGTENEPK